MSDKDPIKSGYRGDQEVSSRLSHEDNVRDDLADKVILIHPRDKKDEINQRNEIPKATLPKQPYQKIKIRRDATVKKKRRKKKDLFSYKYLRKKSKSLWTDYWEIIVTVLTAIIFSLFILPRFMQ